MKFYRLFDLATPGTTTGVFRRTPGSVERLDPKTGAWTYDATLWSYIYNGEIGAEEIDDVEAQRLIAHLRLVAV